MNVTQTPVTNAANLSLFMVNVSYRLLADFRQDNPQFSVLDLKAYYRGLKYVHETIQLLRQKPDLIVMHNMSNQVASLGSIHKSQAALSSE